MTAGTTTRLPRPPAPHEPLLILTERARVVRSLVEPTAWAVLEELGLRARIIDGQAVAEASVRSIAESLGRSKDAVARALRRLIELRLVKRTKTRHGFSGRFVSMHYVIDLDAAGLRLPAPSTLPIATPASSHWPPHR